MNQQDASIKQQFAAIRADQQNWYQTTLQAVLTHIDGQATVFAHDRALQAALLPQLEQALAQDPSFASAVVSDPAIQQQLLAALARQLATNRNFIAAVASQVAPRQTQPAAGTAGAGTVQR